jgi:hypothetical protein
MGNDAVNATPQSHPLTVGFWPDHIARLTKMASEVPFRPGELIFREGVALEVISPGCPVRVAPVAGSGDEERLRHACEDDYAFGFWFMRAILKVLSERMHAIRAQLADVYSPLAAVQ